MGTASAGHSWRTNSDSGALRYSDSAVNASIMFNRPLLGLMHLGIPRPVGILGGRRRIDDRGIVLVATFSLFAVRCR
jgi:hypothetical protein